MNNLKDLYTVAEVAEILGVSEKSVRDFINAGEIEAIKVGQWRIAREAVEEFLEARSNQYRSKARKEILEFLDSPEIMEPGESRTLVVRDYYCSEPGVHGPYVSLLIQNMPEGCNFQWRFFFDQEHRRARHIFTGDYLQIISIIDRLEQKLREEE